MQKTKLERMAEALENVVQVFEKHRPAIEEAKESLDKLIKTLEPKK